MSCNGCRVLRKGCSDSCILRSSLQWIESPEAQGHATVFVAKFFGRAGMLSFINAVAESQRPALFQSLLYEACGRTVNPVFGAVGLLWSGNWAACQAAVETVLKGGSLRPTACPPLAEPLHRCHEKPSLKRCPSLTEPYMTVNAEAKRARSSNTAEEKGEFKGDSHVACADHRKPVCVAPPDAKAKARDSELWRSSETPKQAQRPAPHAQIVVPVARRVRPPTGRGLSSELVATEHQHASSQEQDWRRHRAIELDLSLNSQAFANADRRMMESHADGDDRGRAEPDVESREDHTAFETSACHDDEHASYLGLARSSSPCSFSINSEGSVASVDTPEFAISGVRTLIANGLRQDDYRLLHLL